MKMDAVSPFAMRKKNQQPNTIALIWVRVFFLLLFGVPTLAEKWLKSVCTVTSFQTYCSINRCTVCHLLQKLFIVTEDSPNTISLCEHIQHSKSVASGVLMVCAISFIRSRLNIHRLHITCRGWLQYIAVDEHKRYTHIHTQTYFYIESIQFRWLTVCMVEGDAVIVRAESFWDNVVSNVVQLSLRLQWIVTAVARGKCWQPEASQAARSV